MVSRRVDANERYDVIVIGAGIYGAAHAWEAASRGLSVVLVEQSDFGSATSANSLKTIHGGIRYLQNFNLRRVLESKRERDAFLNIAPHLVQPLVCVMPSYAWTAKGKVATALGAFLYNLIGCYDDLTTQMNHRLWASPIGKRRVNGSLPGPIPAGINGGIRWYDGQAYDTERLVLEFVMAAKNQGASALNYMRARELIIDDNRVRGVVAEDRLDGGEHAIHGKYVVDTTGPWLDRNYQEWRLDRSADQVLARAVNLVYPSGVSRYAFGMKLDARASSPGQPDRLLFAAPWRGRVIVGTWYFPVDDPERTGLTVEEYEICADDARRLCSLPDSDKPAWVHIGLVPVVGDFRMGEYPHLVEETVITDHGRRNGLNGLISVIGAKYTTARAAAEKTIDVVTGDLGQYRPSTTAMRPLYGGETGNFREFCRQKLDQYDGLVDPGALKNLLRSYGSSIDRVMAYGQNDASLYEVIAGTSEYIKAQIVYAVREEFAHRLTDVVVRRIGIGGLGKPGDETIACCADIMASAAAWSSEKKADNIGELEDYYSTRLGDGTI